MFPVVLFITSSALLSEARRKLELTSRRMKVTDNIPGVVADLQTLIFGACERGSHAGMGHPKSAF